MNLLIIIIISLMHQHNARTQQITCIITNTLLHVSTFIVPYSGELYLMLNIIVTLFGDRFFCIVQVRFSRRTVLYRVIE